MYAIILRVIAFLISALITLNSALGLGLEIDDSFLHEMFPSIFQEAEPAPGDEGISEHPDPVDDVIDFSPKSEYNEGVVLVKVKKSFDKNDLGTLAFTSADALYKGSKWYTVTLADKLATEFAVEYLSNLNAFESVDYDYVMGVTDKESENPNYNQQVNLGLSNIPYGWTQNSKHPGGSSDVVIAVIDTGVDYNHLDLRNNIWVNTGEIADNGKDDDGNGYIDDVYGWDCVSNDNNPMDDNGHGTHVAGIIAAENNKVGGIGVAYNCKVMVLKAGNSSGYFNNSDIAEAIQYAYMNGASVINMSFGGSQISVAAEEALENAYNSCVLVAAAGNDGACNDLSCKTCEKVGVTYPAALPYVIGVMSTDISGVGVSSFSNYDHNPYNSVEYEVYAVGEGVGSTWPSNKYSCLNGTSMAAPTVSGIAALLRSIYSDREVYSTKFIQSQIVNTGTINPINYSLLEIDAGHSVVDIKEAINKLPKPEVNLYDYHIDDSASISGNNNGNGVIDAGETVRLYIELHNRGGVASDVNVSIDTDRGNGLTDPYFTFINDTIALSDIGTYSVRESGDKYFEIAVSADCPNDYLCEFNIRFTYKNGMDNNDTTVYTDDGKQKAEFNVSSGYLLPSIITEDTTFTNDRLYIVGEDVTIPEGVTVTFDEGCRIQFYDDRDYYNTPKITVYGKLNILGTKEKMVKLYPSEQHAGFICVIVVLGDLYIDYVDMTNALIGPGNGETEDTKISVNNSYMYSHMVANSVGNKLNYIYFRGAKASVSNTVHTTFGIKASTYSLPKATIIYKGNYIEGMEKTYFNSDVFCENFFRESNEFLLFCEDFENNIVFSKNNISIASISAKISNKGTNNVFIANKVSDIVSLEFGTPANVFDNEFSEIYRQHASGAIKNYYGADGKPIIDVYDSLNDASPLWPYIVGVEISDQDGNVINTVGREEIKVRVTFNRPMDTTKDTFLTFGTVEPYADYKIEGAYVSDTVWEGTYTLKAQIENGQNFLKVNNACAAEDNTKVVFGDYQLHEFTIDTTAAMAMTLQAVATDGGIELTWEQDDYDTLMGYNIYRSESKDGNYVKLNPAILTANEASFLDDNAEPGKTYWYTFTVVLSDFTESAPAGKVTCKAIDNIAPNIYHTPVNQGYENNNLVISCTATDNISVSAVTLYYRTVGETNWKSLNMTRKNDKFSATVFGSDVTMAGLEYYIVATDGVNTIEKGNAETPYTVLVKDASALSGIGDVDGNGTVTTKDALMLIQCLNGDLILTDDEFKRADLNKDKVLSSMEALRILQYINGNVTSLEM